METRSISLMIKWLRSIIQLSIELAIIRELKTKIKYTLMNTTKSRIPFTLSDKNTLGYSNEKIKSSPKVSSPTSIFLYGESS